MRILSHRGWWQSPDEKNTEAAFWRSFSAGYGTETDVRDMDSVLVISHDPPRSVEPPITLDEFLDIYRESGAPDRGLPLALNVKSDGLADALEETLRRYEIQCHAFVFDMSVPDMRAYVAGGLDVFTRHSDLEPIPALYEESQGVWLDAFDDNWFDVQVLEEHLAAGKRVCLVSPDLHGRNPLRFWRRLQGWMASGGSGDGVLICTDSPMEAREALR